MELSYVKNHWGVRVLSDFVRISLSFIKTISDFLFVGWGAKKMLVCNVNIYHSQLVRSIGINCCLDNQLSLFMPGEFTLNLEWLIIFADSQWLVKRGTGWECVNGSVQIHHHCWKNHSGTLNMVQWHQPMWKNRTNMCFCP